MAWFLRAVEFPDRRWACRHGVTEFDVHRDLENAMNHLRELAPSFGAVQLFIHRIDGTVESIDWP
jgi:hypothetical protein